MSKDNRMNDLSGLDQKTLTALLYIEFKDMKEQLRADYVRKDQFLPVKRCCYAIVGFVFCATLTGVVTLLIR